MAQCVNAGMVQKVMEFFACPEFLKIFNIKPEACEKILQSDFNCGFSFIFGCSGSSLLHAGLLQFRQARTTLHCSAQASHCSGFSHYRAQALGPMGSALVVPRF